MVPGVLEAMVGQARRKNAQAGITGLLVLSGRRFLQVVEGPVQFVNELMAKIIADDRHSRFELVSYEQIGASSFHDWSMGVLTLGDLPESLRDMLEGKYGLEDGAVRIPDDRMGAFSLLLDARWICAVQERGGSRDRTGFE